MAQRVTLAVPDPANPGQDVNVGTAANPMVVSSSGGSQTSPTIVGGEYNSTLPTLSNGQTDAIQLDSSGNLRVRLAASALTGVDGVNNAALANVLLANEASSAAARLMAFAPFVFNGSTWDRARGDTTGAFIVETPTGSASNALTVSATSAVASSLVLKASAGNLYGYNIVAGASAGYLMIFNATSAPADGAVTPTLCIPVAANAGLERQFAKPLRFTTGITMVFSTTGPFTKTASATAFLAGEAL